MATGIVSHFVGEIKLFCGDTPPDGWLLCDGTTYTRGTTEADTYWDLWQVLSNGGGSNPWGNGNGSTTFNVPDLRGKTLVGTATPSEVGTTGGAENVTLVSGNMPSHTHTVNTNSAGGSHTHSGTTGTDNTDHQHLSGMTYGLIGESSFGAPNATYLSEANYGLATSGFSSSENTTHTHSFTLNFVGDHSHTISTTATSSGANGWTGGSHNNMPPYLVVNYIIKY